MEGLRDATGWKRQPPAKLENAVLRAVGALPPELPRAKVVAFAARLLLEEALGEEPPAFDAGTLEQNVGTYSFILANVFGAKEAAAAAEKGLAEAAVAVATRQSFTPETAEKTPSKEASPKTRAPNESSPKGSPPKPSPGEAVPKRAGVPRQFCSGCGFRRSACVCVVPPASKKRVPIEQKPWPETAATRREKQNAPTHPHPDEEDEEGDEEDEEEQEEDEEENEEEEDEEDDEDYREPTPTKKKRSTQKIEVTNPRFLLDEKSWPELSVTFSALELANALRFYYADAFAGPSRHEAQFILDMLLCLSESLRAVPSSQAAAPLLQAIRRAIGRLEVLRERLAGTSLGAAAFEAHFLDQQLPPQIRKARKEATKAKREAKQPTSNQRNANNQRQFQPQQAPRSGGRARGRGGGRRGGRGGRGRQERAENE